MKTDTIAAIATAMSPSGIGIVRTSGEEAFSSLPDKESNTLSEIYTSRSTWYFQSTSLIYIGKHVFHLFNLKYTMLPSQSK